LAKDEIANHPIAHRQSKACATAESRENGGRMRWSTRWQSRRRDGESREQDAATNNGIPVISV
jgi:hypothetical protein